MKLSEILQSYTWILFSSLKSQRFNRTCLKGLGRRCGKRWQSFLTGWWSSQLGMPGPHIFRVSWLHSVSWQAGGLIIVSVIWDYRVVWCDWGSPKSQRRSQDLVHLCTGDGVCDVKGAHYLAGGCLGNARANSGLRLVPGLLHVGCTFCDFFSLPDPVWPPACVQLVAVHPGWGGRGAGSCSEREGCLHFLVPGQPAASPTREVVTSWWAWTLA